TPRTSLLPWARRHLLLLLATCAALALAITPHITLGSARFELWTPSENVMAMLGAVRASGRFFWVIGYLAIIAAIILLCRFSDRRTNTVILAFAALVQVADTTPIRMAIGFDAAHGTEVLSAERWEKVLEKASTLIIVPSYECGDI